MSNRKKEICLALDSYDNLEETRGSLSDQEKAHYRALSDELQAIERGEVGQNRQTTPNAPYGSLVRLGKGPEGDFVDLGDFARDVKDAARPGGIISPRLIQNAPTTISTEGVGADGGFAVPADLRSDIWQKVNGENALLPLCDQLFTTSNQIVVPADEGAPWAATGPQASWKAEAGQLSQSKVALVDKTIRLNKLTALIPVTEELAEDSPGLDSYLRRKVAQVFNYELNHAFIQGTGSGEPLGFLTAACLKSVAKESGQSADTLIVENIVNMFNALDPAAIEGAVWLANPNTRAQLMQLKYDTTGGEVMPVFLPGGNLAGKPFSTLLGLPIIFNFALPTLGDKGDIALVNMKQYMVALKSGGMRGEVSMHLWFDYAVLAYRFQLRIAGQPWPASVIVAPDGSTEYSPFVTLDARS